MKTPLRLTLLLVPLALSGCFGGCKGRQSIDTVLSSASSPNHVYRATVLLRQYFLDGHLDDSPTTYVLLDKEEDAQQYQSGEEFKDSQVVMKPPRCGTLHVQWSDDETLRVICVECGLALSAVGPHANGVGRIRIDYDGFPAVSSWEGSSRGH